tara:strand:+ start:11796 stop:12470 length:675 start_codon:yes stop_codon:yes gene_type:complete
MHTNYEYYYNNDNTRNNLVYTSLISKDKQVFCQWYHNDGIYHGGKNEVVDPELMDEKFEREIKFLKIMRDEYPQHVPSYRLDYEWKKIYLEIDGIDFWNKADCKIENYDKVLPDWQEQMLEILHAHKELGLHKYSMHPSSYFIVDGKLKSMNYFFTYYNSEPNVSIQEVESHLSVNRREKMKQHLETLNIQWNTPQTWETMDKLCWNSFRANYPQEFIENALNV